MVFCGVVVVIVVVVQFLAVMKGGFYMEFLDGTVPGAAEVPQDAGDGDAVAEAAPVDVGLTPDADGMAAADVLPPVTVEGVTLDMVYDIISDILGALRDDDTDIVPVELTGQTKETLDAAMVILHQVNACVFFISMCLLYRMVRNSVRRVFNND